MTIFADIVDISYLICPVIFFTRQLYKTLNRTEERAIAILLSLLLFKDEPKPKPTVGVHEAFLNKKLDIVI